MFKLVSFRKIAISFAMFVVVAFGSALVANADAVIINTPNAGLSGTPGPYATVTYVLNGTNIDVTVNMSPGLLAFGQGNGNNGIFGFNIVGSTTGLSVTSNGNPKGFAGDNGTPTAELPEPTTMLLLGTALAGLAACLRKRFKAVG